MLRGNVLACACGGKSQCREDAASECQKGVSPRDPRGAHDCRMRGYNAASGCRRHDWRREQRGAVAAAKAHTMQHADEALLACRPVDMGLLHDRAECVPQPNKHRNPQQPAHLPLT